MAKKKNKKVLIVEDEPALLDLYVLKVQQHGYEAIKASNGKEAMSLVLLEKPNIVILDILMPDVDGYEFLKSLKQDKQTKTIPVIIFSNLSQREEVEKGLKLGAEDFIIKTSITPAELVTKIEQHL